MRELLHIHGKSHDLQEKRNAPTARHSTHIQVVIRSRLVGRRRPTLAAAEVAAAAEAATEVAAGDDATEDEQRAAPAGRHQEVGVDVLLAELLGDVQAQRAVVVVDVAFDRVAQCGVRSVDLLELRDTVSGQRSEADGTGQATCWQYEREEIDETADAKKIRYQCRVFVGS